MVYYDKEELEKVISEISEAKEVKDVHWRYLNDYRQGVKDTLETLIKELHLDIKI